MSAARVLLGFDYGKRRIGIAVGQELTATATPAATIRSNNEEPDWDAISRLIDTWRPQALVVGLPRNMDGSEHELAEASRRFGHQLHDRYHLPVYWVDERLSSVEAEHVLAGRYKTAQRQSRRHRDDVDKIAAQIILQTWLGQRHDT